MSRYHLKRLTLCVDVGDELRGGPGRQSRLRLSALRQMLFIAFHWPSPTACLPPGVCSPAGKVPLHNHRKSRLLHKLSFPPISHISLNIQEVSRLAALLLAQGAVPRQTAWQPDPERMWQRPCELTPEFPTASFLVLIKAALQMYITTMGLLQRSLPTTDLTKVHMCISSRTQRREERA